MDLFSNSTAAGASVLQSPFPGALLPSTQWAIPLSLLAMCVVLVVSESLRLTVLYSPGGGARETPGPRLHPLLGMLPEMARNSGRLHDWIAGILEGCPTLTFSSFNPGQREVYTAETMNIQHILKDNFNNYPKGEDLSMTFKDFLGHGIFNSDGEQWRKQRKAASLEFSTNSLRRLIETSVCTEIRERLIPTLDQAMRKGVAVDMQDVLLRFSFDNICQVGFGHHPGCLAPGFPEVPFAKAFDTATKVTLMRVLMPNPVWHVMKALNVGPERDLKQAMYTIFSFVEHVIEKRKAEIARLAEKREVTSEASSNTHSDLLSRFMLLDAKCQGEAEYNVQFLRDICTNFILAGRDTSSLALTWFFWNLNQHPEVEERVVAEIQAIVAKRGEGASVDKDAPFSYDELKQMNYTHAAINESLRLYPIVPMDFKQALEDDVLPDGTPVPKGARVNYCIYAQGRMKSVWGEDAPEFKPERWLTAAGTVMVESPFKFSAFNAGPRLCLGKDMAYIQMKGLAASVLRKYKMVLAPGFKAEYGLSLTLAMKCGLQVLLQPRN